MSSTPANVTTTPGTGSLFALTLGQLNAGTIIQMDPKAGREMYNKANSPLKVPFDEDSKNINMFQSQLQRRIEMHPHQRQRKRPS